MIVVVFAITVVTISPLIRVSERFLIFIENSVIVIN